MDVKDPLRRESAEDRAPRRAWSVHEASPLLGPKSRKTKIQHQPDADETARERKTQRDSNEQSRGNFILYAIYAVVNVIIAVPGLYGMCSCDPNELSSFVIVGLTLHFLLAREN